MCLPRLQLQHMTRWGLRKDSLLVLLLLLFVVRAPAPVTAQAAARKVNVSSSSELMAALQSDADVLVLHNDVAVGPEFEQFEEAPLSLQRNVTLTGPAGSNASVDSMPVIDLQNKVGILELCSSCTFSFLWVAIANENRAGTGGGISVFRGKPGSKVEWMGGVGLRPACAPTAPAVALVNNTQRSSLFPSPPGGRQLAKSVDFTYKGRQYKDMLYVIDLSSDIVPQQLTNFSFTGGYGIRRRNATRLCDHIVSQQCLQRRLPEDCIAELLASSPSSPQAGSGGVNVVAVAVPVALGGALLMIGAAGVFWWHARKRKRKSTPGLEQQQGGPKPPAGTALLKADPGQSHVQPVADQAAQAWASPASRRQQASSSGVLDQQAALLGPWQLLWSSSSANTAWESQDDIELGVLLGAGSFARVYKGRWSGLDVAVKVIHHDRDSLNAVANEVQLMLNLNHPNIVRAYHCITKQLLPEQLSSPTGLQGPGSTLQSPVPGSAPGSAAGSAAGSIGWLGPHTPGAVRFPSMAAGISRRSSFQQQPQQGLADAMPLATPSSFVPLIDVGSATITTSQTLDRASEAAGPLRQASASTAASLRQASASTTGLQPATPSSGAAAPQLSSAAPTATGSTQFGLLSSSGLSLLAQDLDPGPVYQRRLSAVLGSEGTNASSSSAVHTLPVPTQPQTASSTAAGISRLQAAPAAESSSAAIGVEPATSTAPVGLLSSLGEPPTQQQQLPQSPPGPSSAANTASMPAASSGSISSLIWPPSMSGSGQRPVPLQQKQQQLLPVAPVGPASGPSAVGSAASQGSQGSQLWPMIVGAASEVQPVQALAQLSDAGGTVSSTDGDLGGSQGYGARGGDRGAGEGRSTPWCETWLVTELCDRGTLARQVGEWQPHLYEHDMLRLLHLLRDVACGLKLLKSQNIVHADLNAHNVLVASSSVAPHGLVAKVADLGLSRVLKQQATHRTTGTVGMLTHQPPELLQDGRMSPAVDIYSFGIMMYEVYARQAAYGRLRYGQIYHKVVVLSARPPVPEDMPEDYVLLMKRCWSGDPTDRPSIDMVLECLDLMIEARREQATMYATDSWQPTGDAVV